MSTTSKHITLDEFSRNPIEIFELVIKEKETLTVVNTKGEGMALKPILRAKRIKKTKTKADYAAFIAAAGGWANEDVDAFIKNTYQSRLLSSRPPIEL